MTIRQQSEVTIARLCTDVAAVLLSWILSYYIRFHFVFSAPRGVPEQGLYFKLLPFIAVIWLAVFFILGFYRRSGRHRSPFVEGLDIIYCSVFATLTFIAFSYFYEEYRYSRLTLFIFVVIHPILIITGRSLIRKIRRRQRDRATPKTALIIASADRLEEAKRFLVRDQFVRKKMDTLIVVGTESSKQNSDFEPSLQLPSHDKWTDFLITKSFQEAVVAVDASVMREFDRYIDGLAQQVPSVDILPDFRTLKGFTPIVSETSGTIHLQFRASPLDGAGRLVKRFWDILLSSVGLIVLFPLFVVVAVLVKLSSRGPILYRQERMGLDGNTFEILKFRSMPVNSESQTGAVWARPGDQRATAVGRFLRKSSIDELPQLINILRGEMSIVGPRPERPVFVSEFRRQVPDYMLRHKVKAGLTGWAQVNGWRGSTSLEKRIECDLFYIQNWSVWLDLKIILLTGVRVLFDRNAY